MHGSWAVALLGTLALAGCGSAPRSQASAHAATVHVEQHWAGGGLYVEGSFSYVRLERAGETVEQVRLSNARIPRATLRLDPGSYRLVSFQRPCDGNCSRLDPPIDQCSHELEIQADTDVSVSVALSPGHGCTIAQGQRID